MLTLATADPDTAIVKRWLATALKDADAGRKAALAKHCGVKPQAVSGWLRTGRIRKANLEKAREFLGSSPSFTSSAVRAEEPRPGRAPRWRFALLDLDRINALSEPELLRLEGAWIQSASNLGLKLTKRAAA